MTWGAHLRGVLGRGCAEAWISGHHLRVESQGIQDGEHAVQLIISGVSKPLPAGMRTIHEGVLSVEMELERLFDYHRDCAIWMQADQVMLVGVHQRHQLASAIARGLQGTGPEEKNQALYELARLLGIDASSACEPSSVCALA
jgi:hypothetical protein